MYQSGLALARTVGPLAAGLLFDQSENMPYWIGGGIMIVAFFFAVLTLRRPIGLVVVEKN